MLTYTAEVTSPNKQFFPQEPDHISNYISNASLTLIGSFALNCMRNEKLAIDVALVFHEGKNLTYYLNNISL